MPDVLAFLDKTVPEVISTMAGVKVSCGVGENDAPRPSLLGGVAGSISLTGKFDGVVYTCFSNELACLMTTRILGMEAPGESDVTDVIGELTNMVTGNLKTQLSDIGYPCRLSIPTVMRGDSISVIATDAPLSIRNTYRFEGCADELIVQVFARLQD